MLKTPKNDLTGKRFRNLEVLRMVRHANGKQWLAVCKCHACGRTDYTTYTYWVKKYSHTGSCGCDKSYFERQRGANSPLFRGYKGLRSWYLSATKRRARKLQLRCNLTAPFLWDLFQLQKGLCSLSGIPIVLASNRKSSSGTASLDRIDSQKGYTTNNVQWVHKDIQLMKMQLTEQKFIELCRLVANHTTANS